MRISAIIILLVSSFAAISAQESAHFGAAKFAPEDGKKLLIIGQDLGSVGGLNSYTNGYVNQFSSHVPAGVTSYTSIPSLGGLTNLANWGAGDVQAQAYLNDPTFNHSFIVIGLYLVGVLEGINNGDHDQPIQTLANWVKGQNRPVFIRIGYEFEGPWNAYTPNAFKDAWRHIVHIFDEEEVRNVAYVWQSAGLNYSNIIDWYPGDEYVNWVGYSQFDGQNMGQSIKNLAIQRNKPIMIAEATPRVDLGDGNGQAHWNNWFQARFNEIYSNDRIKAFAYINADWDNQPMWTGQGWGDSRVQIDPLIRENWETEVLTSPWLMADEDLFDALNYEAWISTSTESATMAEKVQLNIVAVQDQIQIQCSDNQLMDKLSVWDFSGRLLHRDSTAQYRYELSTAKWPGQGFIISVDIDGQHYSQKVIL